MYKERFLNEIKFHTAFSKKAVPQPLFQKKRYQKPSFTAFSKKAVPKTIHGGVTAFSKKAVPKTIHGGVTAFSKKSTKNHVPSLFVLRTDLLGAFTALRLFQSKYI
jgi:hypothetical protein